MKFSKRSICAFAALSMLVSFPLLPLAGDEDGPLREKDVQLTLPPEFYAVPGEEMAIYFDNIVTVRRPEDCTFKVTCKLGKTEDRRWAVTPRPPDAGEYPLTVEVLDPTGKKSIAKASTVLKIATKKGGNLKKLRLLVIGDSLTAANSYPAEIARLLDDRGNPDWVMLGKNVYGDKVRHEGYSGWRWETFLTKYVQGTPAKPNEGSSPFVFPDKGGKPELDVERYIKEQCEGVPPDVITVLLGINDCYSAGNKADDKATVDIVLKNMFDNADKLIKELRKAAPNAMIGLCLTPPPNGREASTPDYSRWGWKRVQHRLVQEQMEKFGGREKENIYIIPTELNLDCVEGFPPIDYVHPNPAGYKQIGVSIYAWLKYRLQNAPKQKAGGRTSSGK